jgi:DNA invertase Pin-like site-specific DNA recombinase
VRAKGASLRATEQPIDTSTAAGKCFLDMLGVFAAFETNLRRERQLEGGGFEEAGRGGLRGLISAEEFPSWWRCRARAQPGCENTSARKRTAAIFGHKVANARSRDCRHRRDPMVTST